MTVHATWSSTRTTTTSTRTRTRTTSGCATRPRCTTTRSSASGRCPGTADVLQGFPQQHDAVQQATGSRSTRSPAGPHATKTMSFLAMDDPAHLRLRTLVSKGFTPRRIRELEPRVTELAVEHLDTMLEKADRLERRLRRRVRGQAADGRHLRADGRARRGSRPHPGHGRRRDAPRGRRQRRAASPRSRRRST